MVKCIKCEWTLELIVWISETAEIFPYIFILLPEFLECLNEKYRNASPLHELSILVVEWFWIMLKILK